MSCVGSTDDAMTVACFRHLKETCVCVPHLGHVAYKLRKDLLVHFSLHLHLAKLDISPQPSELLHSNQ